MFLHDGQFVANTRFNSGNDCDWICTVKAAMPEADVASMNGGGYNGGPPAGNLHTDLALLFSLGAIAGILTPAEISAEFECRLHPQCDGRQLCDCRGEQHQRYAAVERRRHGR